MTENKQFIANGNDIWQGNDVWCTAGGKHCADVIATALNEAINENRAIQKKVFRLINWLEKEKGINMDEIKEWWNE